MAATVTGEIEKEENVLVVRRIHVTYHLRLMPEQRPVAERAHRFHANSCPVYRTIHTSVAITTSLEMEDWTDPPS
ncbi:MAG: OsmC family protein [Chloroflexales bacterium]|nr:OsmC family protein [Chloroflexales bacterium]